MCQIKPDFKEKNSGIATIATNRIPSQVAQNVAGFLNIYIYFSL
jgi:hypothetical protein